MRSPLPWLRTNLPVAVFLTGIASGILGALLASASFVNGMQHVIIERGLMLGLHTRQLDELHKNMVDVDRRFNADRAYLEELRRTRDGKDAALEQRIAVLEAQLRFFADRTSPQSLGSRR